MSNLSKAIESMAATFAEGMVTAIRGMSLEELLSFSHAPPSAKAASALVKAPKTTRRATAPSKVATATRAARPAKFTRRGPEEIEKVAAAIVGLLKKNPKGLRSEHIQKELKIAKNEIVRPIATLLDAKRLTKKGQKRSTTYFAK